MTGSRGKSRQEVFSDIYHKNRWGGDPGSYVSGSGSQVDVTTSYVATVRTLLQSQTVQHIVDLGCGDFQVAQRLLRPHLTYVGCDIVPDLVARNNATFANERIKFAILDAVTDPLPPGDLCIIRQVFQHLSNKDIAAVLRKARQYPLLLITDEQMIGDEAPANVDIAPFHGTRRLFGQGLKLERSPFNEQIEVLLEHSSGASGENSPIFDTYLRTVLIRNNAKN
jgi:SAM-dependent methyltransferase